jgi:transcriptional regulator with XRE-family HTH domain
LEPPEFPPPPRQRYPTPKQIFGNKMQALRERPPAQRWPSRAQITQREIAEATGIKENVIQRWENGVGDNILSVGDAMRWAETLSHKLMIKNFPKSDASTTLQTLFAGGGRIELRPIRYRQAR